MEIVVRRPLIMESIVLESHVPIRVNILDTLKHPLLLWTIKKVRNSTHEYIVRACSFDRKYREANRFLETL